MPQLFDSMAALKRFQCRCNATPRPPWALPPMKTPLHALSGVPIDTENTIVTAQKRKLGKAAGMCQGVCGAAGAVAAARCRPACSALAIKSCNLSSRLDPLPSDSEANTPSESMVK